ncbi:hypothetical protein [Nitrosospira sp. NRS527]
MLAGLALLGVMVRSKSLSTA